MADAHDTHHDLPDDQNVAPTHQEIHERFTGAQVAFCAILGVVAIVAGIVTGLTVTNT